LTVCPDTQQIKLVHPTTGVIPGTQRTQGFAVKKQLFGLRTSRFQLQFRIAALSLLGIVFLTGMGYWTHAAVRRSQQNLFRDNLQTILNADILALEFWLELEKNEINALTRADRVREGTAKLVQVQQPELTQIRAQLEEYFQPWMLEPGYCGYTIVDRSGLIIAADPNSIVGTHLSPIGMQIITRAFQAADALVVKPHYYRDLLARADATMDARPVMLMLGAIRDGQGEPLAALMLLQDPEVNFTRILSVARIGEGGSTYAFDEKALMISESRFEEELISLGLLPEGAQYSSLQLSLRDPGGDMTRGFQPRTPAHSRPLTRMAADAIAGGSGIDTDGYRDYRGVTVFGAWRWLPEYGFGVATEVPADEVLQVLNPLNWAFRILFGLLAAAFIVIVIKTWINLSLRQKIGRQRMLGAYVLEEEIGRGGMGIVYRARHGLLRRPTAIKILKPEFGTGPELQRFEREVRITSRLTHPNTVEIYDFGLTPDGLFYYAMEYLPGLNLGELLEMQGAVSPARAVYILQQVCWSLEEAHAMKLIHRDIKPANIILCRRGLRGDVVKVLDFGLVKSTASADVHARTVVNVIAGTPNYVAPERLRSGKPVDARSDIYSLGAVGFNLLTGKQVFEGAETMELLEQVVSAPPPSPSSKTMASIPSDLDALITDCLAKDPQHRPASITVVLERLESLALEERWHRTEALVWWQENAERIRSFKQKHAGVDSAHSELSGDRPDIDFRHEDKVQER